MATERRMADMPSLPNVTDEKWMREALLEAHVAGAKREVPIGCVIVDESADREIARAHNQRIERCDPTAHAEVLALRAAGRAMADWRLADLTAYVTLEPCPMCAGALLAARVRRVVFACADAKAGALVSLHTFGSDARHNHRFEVREGVFEAESKALLANFFRSLRDQGKK